MTDISELAPDREVVLAKEMTKMYEELVRCRASESVNYIPEDVKGEYTIIVGGNPVKGKKLGKDWDEGRGKD